MATRFDTLFSAYAEVGGVEQVVSAKVADDVAAQPDYPAALFEALLDRYRGFTCLLGRAMHENQRDIADFSAMSPSCL